MFRKGQVTVFIIVGILFLALFYLVFYFTSHTTKDDSVFSDDLSFSQPVELVALDCAKKTLHEAIFLVASQGGYSNAPDLAIDYSYFQIPYYFDHTVLIELDSHFVASQIESFMKNNVELCLMNKSFPGLIVHTNPAQPQVTVYDRKVVLSMYWPIDVEEGVKIKTLNMFNVEEQVELGLALNVSQRILTEQSKYPDEVRMSYLTNISEEQGIYIGLYRINDTVIYALDYPNSSFSKDFVFTFAVRYPWE